MNRWLTTLALCSSLLAAACATTGGPRVTSPMSADDERLFDGAVDYVGNPDELGGTWADRFHAEVHERVAASDLVAIVHVTAVNADVDSRGNRTVRVVANVEDRLHGEGPRGLSLAVGARQAGYDTVAGRERQLLERRFVVFVKWAEADGGSIVARWHLHPASDAILAEVRRAIRARAERAPGQAR